MITSVKQVSTEVLTHLQTKTTKTIYSIHGRRIQKVDIQQIKQLYTIIASNYQIQLSRIDSKMYFDNLSLFLADQDYTLVANNLKKHILSSSYLPTIADLVKQPNNLSDAPDAAETRLFIEQRENELKVDKTSDKAYIKKVVEETKRKIQEGEYSVFGRDFESFK